MALTPANVKSTQVVAIALQAPGASFGAGVGIGIRTPTELNLDDIVVQMSSENDFQDAFKLNLSIDGLQNGAATLEILRAHAEAGVQVYILNAAGQWIGFTGADFDSGKLCGLEYELKGNLTNDSMIKTTVSTEVSIAELDAMIVEADPVGVVWTSGEDAAKRLRPGVKNVTIGGANVGLLTKCDYSIKSRSQIVSLSRPVSIGANYSIVIEGAQMANADYEALMALLNATGTVIVNFWNSESIKITNLFGGKALKIKNAIAGTWTMRIAGFAADSSSRIKFNTVAGVIEIVHLDNVAES